MYYIMTTWHMQWSQAVARDTVMENGLRIKMRMIKQKN